MSDTPEKEKPTRPWKRFVFGFLFPVLWAPFCYMIFIGDGFIWGYPAGLALAVIFGLLAGIREKRWAFFYGLATSFAVIAAVILGAEWLKR